MKTIHSAGFVISAMLLAAACGCSGARTITRGQNPISDPAVTPAGHGAPATYGGHGYLPPPHQEIIDHYRYTDVSRYEVDENGQIVTYDPHSRIAGAVQHSPAGPPNPGCPHCHGRPPHGQTCPQCQHGRGLHGHGHGLHGSHGSGLWNSGHFDHLSQDYPQHHFTYGYIRPKNLVYPPPEVPGGAVVYPYYTHKGPSDFFRQ